MVVLLVLDAERFQTAPDLGPLVLRHPHGRVRARAAGLVDRDPGRAQVRHHRVALGLHDARSEDALVEGGGPVRIGRLDGDVVDPWHAPPRMRRAVLVVNPFATQVTEERVEAVRAELSRGAAVETLLTERPGHAVELVEAVTETDAIFVFSGDGGFNEALNGADGEVPLGFIPGGGTSVLPRTLGLPRDPVAAAAQLGEALATGRTRRISVGRANGRRFGFSCGVGLDAEAVRRVDELGRTHEGRRPGDLAFVRVLAGIVLERRGRFDPVLEVRGLGRAAFAIVANANPYTYAGSVPVRAAPLTEIGGGLDLVAPVRIRPSSLPRILAYVARGRGQERARDIIYGHDLDRIEIVCDKPLPVHVDGEDLGDVEELVCECERAAVPVLV